MKIFAIVEFQVKFKVSGYLFLKDPESSDLGRAIVSNAIDLIFEIGFEQFTFKKLAAQMHTTEATVYRYFASKHRLLVYILTWYWYYLELMANLRIGEGKTARNKLEIILDIITHRHLPEHQAGNYNLERLHAIVVSESSKAYLVKEVDEINKELVYSPLKSLCRFIGDCITAYSPGYAFPLSLASTLLETAHSQHFFSEHLPRLTDNKTKDHHNYVHQFLSTLLFSVLEK